MRRFFFKLATFFIPAFLIAYSLDLYISNSFKKTNMAFGEYEVWNDIYNGNVNADIAIFGSSRAWLHFNPKLFESRLNKSTYNLGLDGHNFWLQYLRYKEYFKFNKHPETIIYSVDVFSLRKRKDLYNKKQFLPYMLWNYDIYKFTRSYDGFSIGDYFVPLLRYFGNVRVKDFKKILSANENKKYRCQGFKGMDLKWDNESNDKVVNNQEYFVDVDTASIILFKSFIKDLKAENINILFVYSPEYIGGQNIFKNRNEMIGMFTQLAKEFEVPFLDYSDSIISSDRKLFYNNLHLTKEGADLFTNNIIDYLESNKTPEIKNNKMAKNNDSNITSFSINN